MKRLFCVIPLVCLLCFAFGCQDKAAMAELEEFRAQAAVEEQNKELIRNFLGELDSGNWDIFHEIFADDCKFYFPSDNAPVSKKEQFGTLDVFLNAFPKWEHSIKDIFAKDDKVVVWTVDSTIHEGEFQGILATGRKVGFGVITIYRIKEDKIVEFIEEANMLGLMMQLGMDLKPKEVEK